MTYSANDIKRSMELIEYSTTHAILPEGMADAVKLLRDVVREAVGLVRQFRDTVDKYNNIREKKEPLKSMAALAWLLSTATEADKLLALFDETELFGELKETIR